MVIKALFSYVLQAKEINQNPLWYNIATGFSSSYALCLPVGTPGNLVVQGAANIPTSKMVRQNSLNNRQNVRIDISITKLKQ